MPRRRAPRWHIMVLWEWTPSRHCGMPLRHASRCESSPSLGFTRYPMARCTVYDGEREVSVTHCSFLCGGGGPRCCATARAACLSLLRLIGWVQLGGKKGKAALDPSAPSASVQEKSWCLLLRPTQATTQVTLHHIYRRICKGHDGTRSCMCQHGWLAVTSCDTPRVTAGSELLRQQRCTSSQCHPLSGKDVDKPSVCTAPSTQNARRCSYFAWRVLIHHLVFLNTSTLGADRLHRKPSPTPLTTTPFPLEVWSRGRPHFLVHLRSPSQCHLVGGQQARVPQLPPVSAGAVFVASASPTSPRIASKVLGFFSSPLGSTALLPLGAPSSGRRATPSSTAAECRQLQLLVDF